MLIITNSIENWYRKVVKEVIINVLFKIAAAASHTSGFWRVHLSA